MEIGTSLKLRYILLSMYLVSFFEIFHSLSFYGIAFFFCTNTLGYIVSNYDVINQKAKDLSPRIYFLWPFILIFVSLQTIYNGTREEIANMLFFVQLFCVSIGVLAWTGSFTILPNISTDMILVYYGILCGLEAVVVYIYIRKVVSLHGIAAVLLILFWPYYFLRNLLGISTKKN
jgi:hypothetical protein